MDCEEALIERARQGDQEAFRQLWEEHHGVAMAAALRLCHEPALAEDVTQGSFLLAWRGLPRFQTGLPFRPWLMRIMYRHDDVTNFTVFQLETSFSVKWHCCTISQSFKDNV